MTMAVHTESDLMLFSLRGWEFPDHQAREFTKTVCKRPLLERLSPVMGARFPCFAPMRLRFTSKTVEHSRNLLG